MRRPRSNSATRVSRACILYLPTYRPVTVGDQNRIAEFAFAIGPVPFTYRGLYEFQLWVDGIDQPVGRERIEAYEEWP